MPSIYGGGPTSQGPLMSRSGRNGSLVLEQEVVYRVIADSVGQSPDVIRTTTSGLPITGVGDCRNVRMEQVPENRLHWLVTVSLSTEVAENNDPATPQTGDPVDWIPQAEVEFEPMEEVARKDKDNKLYLNTAGDPFESGLILHRRIPTRVFSQFERVGPFTVPWVTATAYRRGQYVTSSGNIYQATAAGTSGGTAPSGTGSPNDGGIIWSYKPPVSGAVNIDQIEARSDAINSTAFLGRPAKTLLLEVRKATIGTYYGYRVWRVDYAVKYKKDTWTIKQYSMGWRYKSGTDKKSFDDNGAPFLGKLQTDGTPVANQLTDDPAIQEFREFELLDFNTFLRVV